MIAWARGADFYVIRILVADVGWYIGKHPFCVFRGVEVRDNTNGAAWHIDDIDLRSCGGQFCIQRLWKSQITST